MTAIITTDRRSQILYLPRAIIRDLRAKPGDTFTIRARPRRDGCFFVRIYRAREGGGWLQLLGGGKTRTVLRKY